MKTDEAKRSVGMPAVIVVVLAVAACVPPAGDAGFPAGVPLERVNLGEGGVEANGAGADVSVSADGRYVALVSEASNLAAGDTNLRWDVFVYDRQTDAIERVSVSSGGAEANSDSHTPSVSGDGRYVAFSSEASNLVAGDTNGCTDIFVYDRVTDAVERVSVNASGDEANDSCFGSVISANGRYVAFYTDASNLVAADTNGVTDVFVHDRQTDTVERANVSGSGVPTASEASYVMSISPDGRFVAFYSNATDLVPDDTNGTVDVFVRDRQNATTERVSVSTGGGQANSMSFGTAGALSANGRYVVFYSTASNLAPDDANGVNDVFIRDRQSGTTERLSVNGGGTDPDGPSLFPSISGDGRYVVFESEATDLAAGDGNAVTDVFVCDRSTGAIERLSVSAAGTEGNGESLRPALSADGRYAVFRSDASNLVTADANGVTDIFAAPAH